MRSYKGCARGAQKGCKLHPLHPLILFRNLYHYIGGDTCHLVLETEPGGFFVRAFRKGKPVVPDGARVVACFARGWRRRTRRSCGARRWDGVGLQRAGDADEAVLRSVPLGWRGLQRAGDAGEAILRSAPPGRIASSFAARSGHRGLMGGTGVQSARGGPYAHGWQRRAPLSGAGLGPVRERGAPRLRPPLGGFTG